MTSLITDYIDGSQKVSNTQVDLTYFNSLVASVFSDRTKYTKLLADLNFVNTVGARVFSYTSTTDEDSLAIWRSALNGGLDTCITDATDLKALITGSTQNDTDLKLVLDQMVTDFNTLKGIL